MKLARNLFTFCFIDLFVLKTMLLEFVCISDSCFIMSFLQINQMILDLDKDGDGVVYACIFNGCFIMYLM